MLVPVSGSVKLFYSSGWLKLLNLATIDSIQRENMLKEICSKFEEHCLCNKMVLCGVCLGYQEILCRWQRRLVSKESGQCMSDNNNL
jgi:hypothetical protein